MDTIALFLQHQQEQPQQPAMAGLQFGSSANTHLFPQQLGNTTAQPAPSGSSSNSNTPAATGYGSPAPEHAATRFSAIRTGSSNGNGASHAAASSSSSTGAGTPALGGGPALQATHPSAAAAAAAAEFFRARSASPWMPAPTATQQHHHLQHHTAANAYAASIYNAPSMLQHMHHQQFLGHPQAAYPHHTYQHQPPLLHHPHQHAHPHYAPHPLSQQLHPHQQQQHHHHSPSPEAQHRGLAERGHSPEHHHYDSHTLAGGHSHPFTYPHELGNPHLASTKSAAQEEEQAGHALTAAQKRAQTLRNKTAQAKRAAATAAGSTSADAHDIVGTGVNAAPIVPGHPSNYGILDETNTTLWDLRDGNEGRHAKPPYPYLTLIRIALLSSTCKRLTLQELYDVLESRYPFFRAEDKGWKNSIRHNLSLNKCFKKEARAVLDPGKGSYWYVDLGEEHSTPRIRDRRKQAEEAGNETVEGRPTRSKSKKRKASPIDSAKDDDGEASPDLSSQELSHPFNLFSAGHTVFPPPTSYADDARRFGSSFREVKPRLAANALSHLQLPASPSLHHRGRARAISAPSPITPNFFQNSFSTNGGAVAASLALANAASAGYLNAVPAAYTFPNTAQQSQTHSLQALLQHTSTQHFQPQHQQQQQQPVTEYNHYEAAGQPSAAHLAVSVPGMVEDKAPGSGGTESTFAPETPQTGFPAAPAADGKAASDRKSPNPAEKEQVSAIKSSTVEESGEAVVTAGNAGEASVNGATAGSAASPTPGPPATYVFPPPPSSSSVSGQPNRIFVNPPGTTHIVLQPRGGASARAFSDSYSSSAPTDKQAGSDAKTARNPFSQNSANAATAIRPAPLQFTATQDGKTAFSPPSATSPTRHLASSEYDLFANAPFGVLFDGPAKKQSRSGSIFGLAAR